MRRDISHFVRVNLSCIEVNSSLIGKEAEEKEDSKEVIRSLRSDIAELSEDNCVKALLIPNGQMKEIKVGATDEEILIHLQCNQHWRLYCIYFGHHLYFLPQTWLHFRHGVYYFYQIASASQGRRKRWG